MRFLVDRCAGRQLADWLREKGYDVLEARELGPDPGDGALLGHANAERRILVTIDTDFGELVFLHDVAHSGLVRLPLVTLGFRDILDMDFEQAPLVQDGRGAASPRRDGRNPSRQHPMRTPASMKALEELGRVRLSEHFFMREMLYSEIANFHGIATPRHRAWMPISPRNPTALGQPRLQDIRPTYGIFRFSAVLTAALELLTWTPSDCAKEVFTMAKTHPPYAPEFRRQMVELVR